MNLNRLKNVVGCACLIVMTSFINDVNSKLQQQNFLLSMQSVEVGKTRGKTYVFSGEL